MAKYYGSSQTPGAPIMRARKMEHTSEQINEWWEVLTKGANEDINVSRDLNKEPGVLYFLNDKGMLTPAVGRNQDLGSEEVRGQLLDYARAGRLFLRGLSDDYPRQIKTDDQYKVGITNPTNTLPEAQGNLPAKPRKPFLFILKSMLRFLFKDELQAYEARKERYDQAVQRREMIQNFGENVKKTMKESIDRETKDPDIAARKEEQNKALTEAWEQRKTREAEAKEAAEKEWMNNPSRDTLGTFENHLRDMYIKDFSLIAQKVLDKKGATVGEYLISLAQMLEQQVAIPLLDKVDEFNNTAEKDAFLLQHQGNYIKMMKNLKTFVPSQINIDRATEFLQTEKPTAKQKEAMYEEMRQLVAKGLTEYQNLIPPKPGQQPQQQMPQQIEQQPQQIEQPQQPSAPVAGGAAPF